jgi:hypothetical protein
MIADTGRKHAGELTRAEWEREFVRLAIGLGRSVPWIADRLGWPRRKVLREIGRANRIATAIPALCACGCGRRLPAEATRRRRFLLDSCRSKTWRLQGERNVARRADIEDE